jgi:hypothetical protein
MSTKPDLTGMTPDEIEFYHATQKYLKILDDKQNDIVWPDSTSEGSEGESRLIDSITRADTTIHVSSYLGFPSCPFKVLIGGEYMYVTKYGTSNGHYWDVVRGLDGTASRTHYAGDKISLVPRT